MLEADSYKTKHDHLMEQEYEQYVHKTPLSAHFNSRTPYNILTIALFGIVWIVLGLMALGSWIVGIVISFLAVFFVPIIIVLAAIALAHFGLHWF